MDIVVRYGTTHVLLFPEGVLVPNATAPAILELCDGSTTIGEIASRLDRRFTGVGAADVVIVLERLAERRGVEWA